MSRVAEGPPEVAEELEEGGHREWPVLDAPKMRVAHDRRGEGEEDRDEPHLHLLWCGELRGGEGSSERVVVVVVMLI
jgi:hypothetical protein